MNRTEIQRYSQGMVGRIIADRYRLDAVIGMGGTGIVFRATALGEGQQVAVKTIRKDLAHDVAISRFFRGARLASSLSHPGVVQTLAYGQAKGPEGVPFQVMPLVHGPSWEDLVHDKLSVSEKVWLVCQVLDALAYVHARGVLHRDMKPANILLERQADDQLRPRITDFGISSAFHEDAGKPEITGSLMLMGTPMFMAPEQAQPGALNGPELDLYSVGVMLYLLLSGRLPFEGAPMAVLAAKATVDPPVLEVPGLDPAIGRVVRQMIAREPRHRYALAAQARRALQGHSVPLVVTDQRLAEIVQRQRRAPPPQPPTRQWQPPGPQTLELAWPTLVVAMPASEVTDGLAGRGSVLRSIDRVAIQVERKNVCVISILGESGMGKTAVLERVAANLGEEGRFLVLRAQYFEAGGQAGGVRRGVERMLGVQGLNRQEVRQAVQTLLARYDDVFPDEVDQLVDCLRPSEGVTREVLSTRLAEHMTVVARLFRRLSKTRPLLVLVDDADKASSDLARFLEFMLIEARYDPWPMLVLCAVDGSNPNNPFWQAVVQTPILEGPGHTKIQLQPIEEEALVTELMGRHGLSQPQARRVAQHAAGNPLHAAHLAEFLDGEMGLLNSDSDVSLGTGLRAIPPALIDLMKLKLDRQLDTIEMPEHAAAVLEAMAILGQVAGEDLVKAMLPDPARVRFEHSLSALLEMGVVGIVDHADPVVIGFSPALIRDAVLAEVSPDRLAELHRRAIEVRMTADSSRLAAHWGALGDHHAALGDLSDASRCWLKGMYHEVSKGNVARGVTWGTQAIEHMDREESDWAFITLLVGAMAFDAGESSTAEYLMRTVLKHGDVDQRLQAGDLLCDLLENRGNTEEWRKVIEQMTAIESGAGAVGKCAMYCARSMWLGSVGRPLDGLKYAQQALEHAAPGPAAQRASQRLAFAFLPQLQLHAALKAAQRSVAEAGSVPLLQARSRRILGLVQLWLGRPSAVETLRRLPELCRESGQMTRYPIALHDLGDAFRINGAHDEAREKYRETIRLCEGLPLASTAVLCRFKLAMCDILEDRPLAILPGMDALVAEGLEVGLGHSARFGALLCSWAQAVRGEVALSLAAVVQVGPLQTIMIDPQVPMIVLETCRRLVERVLSTQASIEHISGTTALCTAAAQMYGAIGDTASLQQLERLRCRLPSVPV